MPTHHDDQSDQREVLHDTARWLQFPGEGLARDERFAFGFHRFGPEAKKRTAEI